MATGPAASATLVIHPGALGDFVQAVPAIAALRGATGRGRFALLTQHDVAPLAAVLRADGAALFDDVLSYDARAMFAGGVLGRLRGAASIVGAIRAGRFDTAVIYKAAPAYAALAVAAGVPRRVGFARTAGFGARLLRAGLLTHAVPYPPQRHREDRYADLARTAGADAAHPARIDWGSEADTHEAATLLAPVRARGVVLVGIAPGGARNAKEEMPARRWPSARFAELAAQITRVEPRARVVLLGGPRDRPEADAVLDALEPERVLDLVGRTSVPVARAVIASLDAFVGNDSALLHLAATTSTPAVAVFGPSDPAEACPRRASVTAVWDPARAVACLDDVTGRLPPCVTPCCIERVKVGSVLGALLRVLPSPGRARAVAALRTR